MGGALGTIFATFLLDPGVVWLSKRNKGIYEPEFRLMFVLALSLVVVTAVPLQDAPAAAQLDRGVLAGQGKFPRAALPLPQAAGQFACLGSYDQSQAARSLVVAQGGAQTGGL